MNIEEGLARLNRLREDAGKRPLSQWKATPERLQENIDILVDAGYSDALPGANLAAKPVAKDPIIIKSRGMDMPAKDTDREVTKSRSGLARGLENGEPLAVHSKKAFQDSRKKVKLSEADKRQIKDEARLRKGEIDPKKYPEKAQRQKDKIEAKQKARAGKPGKRKEIGKDEITVADIARELKIDPKIARAKLRRHESKIEELHTKGQDRWTFPIKATDTIKKILKG